MKRRHLREVGQICPAFSALSNGLVLNRCELDRGHEGAHKDGPSHWGAPSVPEPRGENR